MRSEVVVGDGRICFALWDNATPVRKEKEVVGGAGKGVEYESPRLVDRSHQGTLDQVKVQNGSMRRK